MFPQKSINPIGLGQPTKEKMIELFKKNLASLNLRPDKLEKAAEEIAEACRLVQQRQLADALTHLDESAKQTGGKDPYVYLCKAYLHPERNQVNAELKKAHDLSKAISPKLFALVCYISSKFYIRSDIPLSVIYLQSAFFSDYDDVLAQHEVFFPTLATIGKRDLIQDVVNGLAKEAEFLSSGRHIIIQNLAKAKMESDYLKQAEQYFDNAKSAEAKGNKEEVIFNYFTASTLYVSEIHRIIQLAKTEHYRLAYLIVRRLEAYIPLRESIGDEASLKLIDDKVFHQLAIVSWLMNVYYRDDSRVFKNLPVLFRIRRKFFLNLEKVNNCLLDYSVLPAVFQRLNIIEPELADKEIKQYELEFIADIKAIQPPSKREELIKKMNQDRHDLNLDSNVINSLDRIIQTVKEELQKESLEQLEKTAITNAVVTPPADPQPQLATLYPEEETKEKFIERYKKELEKWGVTLPPAVNQAAEHCYLARMDLQKLDRESALAHFDEAIKYCDDKDPMLHIQKAILYLREEDTGVKQKNENRKKIMDELKKSIAASGLQMPESYALANQMLACLSDPSKEEEYFNKGLLTDYTHVSRSRMNMQTLNISPSRVDESQLIALLQRREEENYREYRKHGNKSIFLLDGGKYHLSQAVLSLSAANKKIKEPKKSAKKVKELQAKKIEDLKRVEAKTLFQKSRR